jgi:hypothetical protein
MSLLKRIRNFILLPWVPLIIGIVIVFILFKSLRIPFSPAKWFTAQPVRIDETPIIISEIRQMAMLHTAKLYCEVVTDSVVVSNTDMALQALRDALLFPPISSGLSPSKKMVIVAKGQVIAGIDLSGISENDIRVNGDTVWLQLPAAEILEVISNPSDMDIFIESGQWSSDETILVKQKAIRQMRAEADRRNLLRQANDRGAVLMGNFLKAAGYPVAVVEIKS